MRQGMNCCGCFHLLCFERFQKAIDHSLGSRIALGHDFVPDGCTVALPNFPAIEHIGRIGIKLTGIFASWSRVRSHSSVKPMTDGSLANCQPTGNLFRGQTLLVEALDLLIACLSLGPSC